jgi:hypothetical protein
VDEVLARAVVAGGLFILIVVLAFGVRRFVRWRSGRVLDAPPDASLATGAITVLYFHGDQCGDCLVQERELDRLLITYPEIAIRADHAPSALSARFGVLTVPTTVILDDEGRARAVNPGLVRLRRLEQQVQSARERYPGARALHRSRV